MQLDDHYDQGEARVGVEIAESGWNQHPLKPQKPAEKPIKQLKQQEIVALDVDALRQ